MCRLYLYMVVPVCAFRERHMYTGYSKCYPTITDSDCNVNIVWIIIAERVIVKYLKLEDFNQLGKFK